ncbi:putative baseplate assembly protein [Pseudanabaenaceae cyanobacterium LEGE 13415]|nr:putative baseplate assembly protein [Pseudanabaenaceae cyanobacterium LEGE 13415]
MEFDFLPKLPNSNLDDRTFDDLVEECLLRIPRYCPEWTDHNLSDPGVTLIELFAWLTDQMLLRFNQVPRKNYVAFLELLGIRLQPPAPAQTYITFYLTTSLPECYPIPQGTEVATERTETQEAVIFSTDEELSIGKAVLHHFLTAPTADDTPQALHDRSSWRSQTETIWTSNELPLFSEQPQPGNCFYLVLGAEESIDGNVLAIQLKGARGTPTGINPDQPPRRWEAWNGQYWQSVLREEADDATRGFSFHEAAQQGGSPEQGADVVLHLPEHFPATTFTAYRGRWLRCVLTTPTEARPGYINSPRIISIGVRTIGGTVRSSQSVLIQQEQLGISNGKPGQSFQVQSPPILSRRPGETVIVTPPGGLPQTWQEVADFADSEPNDRHYTINALTGTIQFGPLVREPEALKLSSPERSELPVYWQPTELPLSDRDSQRQRLEHQYGAVPPRGSVITLMAYRTGGGKKGNVQAETLRFLKSSVPYVDRVTNYESAQYGVDAESLDQAVLRAPRILRSRDRAVTPEDFEVLALQAGQGAIARVRCLPTGTAGTVSLLVVPQAIAENPIRGISPDRLTLTSALQDQTLQYLNERKLLGVQVKLETPAYTGVSVQVEIAIESTYHNPAAQQEILNRVRIALYCYLNPITGGHAGTGWEFGRPVYPSDLMALLQQISGVRYLGAVLLFPLRWQDNAWQRQPSPEPYIDPGALGLICSWADDRSRSGHVVNLIRA